MGVMDALGDNYGDLLSAVGALRSSMAARLDRPPHLTELREMGFTSRHIEMIYAAGTPPAGIFGVGVADLGNQPRPAVFMMIELLAAPVEMAGDTPARAVVKRYHTADVRDLVLVGLPRVGSFGGAVTGGRIVVGDQECTLGVPVGLAAGRRGYLTAGHGARTVDDQVFAGGLPMGRVLSSSCRELAQPRVPVADVAVIALDAGAVEGPDGAPPVRSDGQAAGGAVVSARLAGGLRQARVWGRAPEFFPDSYAGWGEVLLCSPLSRAGDSGGAVVLDDDTSVCVGHVVGGAEGHLTVVQQLRYQLDAAGVELRV